MQTYNELSKDQQDRAVESCLDKLVHAVCEGAIQFDDDKNDDDLQGQIDVALQAAEDADAPWFACEYLRDVSSVWAALTGIARAEAEDALYADADEYHRIQLTP